MTKTYSGIEVLYPDLDTQGGDILYGGAGKDWIFAMGGDDFVDGGIDDDVVLGQVDKGTVFVYQFHYANIGGRPAFFTLW